MYIVFSNDLKHVRMIHELQILNQHQHNHE
jgi:hypothetical protein